MIAVGTHLGPYQIVSRLGSGGMGEVFRARDQRLGREVAIKVLPEKMAQDREAIERFEREARALAALSHPNILIIYDFNVDKEMAFAVTELLEGETLRAHIERGALTLERALEVGIAISEGLAAAHSRGVIHRDLKPENIFITIDNVIKILDFGLARLDQKQNKADDQDMVSTLWSDTKPATIMGTIPYMSPEQVRGNLVDARTDIFSFGCVLYEMLSGSNPFYSGSMVETMAAILKDHPPELAKSAKKVVPEVDPIISQCLAKDPDQRYQSARDVVTALKRLQSGSWTASMMKDTQKEINNSLSRRNTTRKLRKLIDSLAILPFTNESQHPDAEYLTDGITESIINIVSQLPKLRVMARSTVFRYKNKPIDPMTIGEELKVRAVLTGRVIQRGDTLNIQAELVDVSDGAQVWGAHYLRKFSDIFELQEEIADQISEQLKIKLSGEEKKRLAKRATKNPEAYQLYLKGRHFWNKRTPDMLKKGIEYFQQAIDIDVNFALAYAGLADCYIVLGTGETLPPRDMFPKAKAAALRALELDECLAEAHTSLAMVKHRFDHDWQGAERAFQRALELNPNYATAHHWYSTYLQTLGRFDEAMAQVKKAQELDPLSLIINAAVGLALHYSRLPDLAIAQFVKTLEMDTNFAPAYLDLMWAYFQKGMMKEAITHGQRGIALLGDIAFATKIGHGFAESGAQGALRRMLEHSKEQAQFRYVSPYRVAVINIHLDELDLAFEWLKKGYEERSNGMVFLKIDPMMDKIRNDARFNELLLRVGLPQ